MPLIDTLLTVFEDAKELLNADQLNSEALLHHNEKLKKLIELHDEKIKNADSLLKEKNKKLTSEEIAEMNAIGKYSAVQRDLKALFPIFAYMALHQETTQSLYAWLLDWQLSTWNERLAERQKHLLKVELDHLIKHFIEFNKHAAINYYHNNQEELDRASILVKRRIQGIFSEEEKLTAKFEEILNEYLKEDPEKKSNEKLTEKFEELLDEYIEETPNPTEIKTLDGWKKYFNHMLKGQRNEPQSIVPLALHYYTEPYAFAAILMWVLEHGVTPFSIIYSGLLHHFFAGNAAYMESLSEENPLTIVYENLARLGKNNAAAELYRLAKQYSAYVSDSVTREALFVFKEFDLTGQRHTKEMRGRAKTETEAESETDLMELEVLSRNQITPIKASINNNPENIQALSKAFSSTFLKLLANDPEIAKHFTREQWQNYFTMAAEAIGDDVTSFPDWFNLHALLVKHNSPLSAEVMSRVIETALLYRRQMEGDYPLMTKIRLLIDTPVSLIILEKANALIASLDACIVANASELSQSSYHVIEDVWQEKHALIKFLGKLYASFGSFPSYPKDIYALQAKVLQIYMFSCNQPNLEEALQLMCASYTTKAESLAHEKRLLESWMVTDCNQQSFHFIGRRLFEKHKMSLQSLTESSGINLFILSCTLGDLSLVTRMLATEGDMPTKWDVRNGFMRAAENGHDLIVILLLNLKGKNGFDQSVIGAALKAASQSKKGLATIDALLTVNQALMPVEADVTQSLWFAAEECHWDIVNRILAVKGDNAPKISQVESSLFKLDSLRLFRMPRMNFNILEIPSIDGESLKPKSLQ